MQKAPFGPLSLELLRLSRLQYFMSSTYHLHALHIPRLGMDSLL